MKISGSATVHALPGQVWVALNDPAVLARTIPGCEHLEVTGPGSCHLTVTAAVASTNGTYTSEISLIERQEPTSLQLAIDAAGAPGTLTATLRVQLAPTKNGSTELTYDADALPDGMIAGVGQRLLATTAKKMAAEFFASVEDMLMDRAATVPGPGGVGEPRPPQGVRAGGAAGVASPAAAPTQGASGLTSEPSTADRQPAGRLRARPPTEGFLSGVLVGAAATLAGIGMARLLGRRSR
jgi:uncharacterized protein